MSCLLKDHGLDRDGLLILLLLIFLSLLLPFNQIVLANDDPNSFGKLIDELQHSDADQRWNAIEALGTLGDPRAVPPLIAALRKDMKQRRGFAMGIIPVLGQLGDERAVPILIEALDNLDDDWLGREAAAKSLGEINSTNAVPALLQAAWRADTRGAAIEALARIGDPRSINVLLSTFSEPEEPEVREAAVAGLIRIGKGAVPALIDKFETHQQEYPAYFERALAAKVLGEIGDQRAVEPLTAALDGSNAKLQKNIKDALNQLERSKK